MSSRVLLVFVFFAFCLAVFGGGPTACGAEPDIHKTAQAIENTCVTCHQSAFVATFTPKHEGLFSQTCDNCHDTVVWVPLPPTAVNTIHDEDAIKDGKLKCGDAACHKDEYDATTTPKHGAGQPIDGCPSCHHVGSESCTTWMPSKISSPTKCGT